MTEGSGACDDDFGLGERGLEDGLGFLVGGCGCGERVGRGNADFDGYGLEFGGVPTGDGEFDFRVGVDQVLCHSFPCVACGSIHDDIKISGHSEVVNVGCGCCGIGCSER